jgi:putative ABC transport system permease protein
MLWETVRLALLSVRRNVLRSFLTLLGIVIGVAAVIAMITIGSGTTEKVRTDISKLGSNLLVVRAARPDRSGSTSFTPKQLDDNDVAALAAGLTNAKAVAAAAQKQVRVVYGAENIAAEVTGTDTDYFIARDWNVLLGRAFTESEVRGGTGVCVIGETVRSQFFGGGDPLGQTIRVNRSSCKVIGVLESKGTSGFGQDQDNVVTMPLVGYQRRIAGDRDVDAIYVAAADGVPTSTVQADIETILRETRRIAPGADDNFEIRDMTQIAEAMTSATTTMTGMLGAVAGVSLLVGGIGIMNIMLVSVTERTREIGIRMAIGARGSDVLTQFLVESVAISMLGGLIGVAIGFGGAWLVGHLTGWSTVTPPEAVLIAVAFSAAVGVFFGFYPARQAASLNPIQALRYE